MSLNNLTDLKQEFDAAKRDGDKDLMKVLKNIEQFFTFGERTSVYPESGGISSAEVVPVIFDCRRCGKLAWEAKVRATPSTETCLKCNDRFLPVYMRSTAYKLKLQANAQRLAKERGCETCKHYRQNKNQTFPQCNTSKLCPALFSKPETAKDKGVSK